MPMTGAEFLIWEAAQDLKWEFDGFQPVAMAGGSDAHAGIQNNLARILYNQLRGKPCRPRGPDMKVQTSNGYRYPDAFVYCTPVPPGTDIVTDPVVVFEIISPSTARDDKTTKLIEYRSLPSVQRYAMIEQDEMLVTIIARTDTGWSFEILDANGTIAMPEIGIAIPMADLYEGLTFER